MPIFVCKRNAAFFGVVTALACSLWPLPLRAVAAESSFVGVRQQIEQNLDKAVPRGSSSSRTKTWLRSQGAVWDEARGERLRDPYARNWLHDSNAPPGDLAALIVGFGLFSFRGTSYYYAARFCFDKQDELVSLSVLRVHDGKMRPVPGKPSIDGLKRTIQEQLPRGSSRTRVEAWLRRRKLAFSHRRARGSELGSSQSRAGTVTESVIRNASEGFFSDGDISLVFLFNNSGQLIKYSVTEIVEGFRPL